MKEAVGESSMTIVTILLIAGVIGGLWFIFSNLLTNQAGRADCENAGYSYSNGKCMNGSQECQYNKDLDDYICG